MIGATVCSMVVEWDVAAVVVAVVVVAVAVAAAVVMNQWQGAPAIVPAALRKKAFCLW